MIKRLAHLISEPFLGPMQAMSYLVLARKYRPQKLDELVGQQHIARALSNAIRMDRVAHAYLFCGARGTGKTSTARILAKMLNCKDGPTVEPCGTCQACREIAQGSSIDVYELDAASNRGVGEIRDLREGVGYAPARDRHKVYIVDEAHMLTTEAANAFLKTLEEPPDHAVFILATTDPQRLPVTIRSRCQRYDFRRIRAAEVVAALEAIVASEKIELDRDALYLVAREGDGSMRDSLSVLDQVIAFGGDTPGAGDVAALLGVADRQRTAGLIEALLGRDSVGALRAVGAAHQHGIDLRTFARTLAMEARDVLVVRLSQAAARDLVDRSDTEIDALRTLADGIDTAELERLAHVLLEIAEAVAQARHPRLVIEMGVVRLCEAARLLDVAALATRVDGLLRGGGALPRPDKSRAKAPQARARPQPNRAPNRAKPTGGGGLPPRRRLDAGRSPRKSSTKEAPPASEEPSTRRQAVPPKPPPVQPVDKNVASPPSPAPRAAPAKADTAKSSPQSSSQAPRGRSLRDNDLAAWESVLRDKRGDAITAALVAQAVVASSGPGRVALAFRNRFYADKARDGGTLRVLRESAETAFSGSYVVEIAGIDDRARTDSLAGRRAAESEQVRRRELEALRTDEHVRRVVDVFSGRIAHAVSETDIGDAAEEG